MKLREDSADKIKRVSNTLNSIKGILLDADSESALSFADWTMKKLRDKYNNSMETSLKQEIRKIQKYNDQASIEMLAKLKKKKKQYMPKEYPRSLDIGDIVNVKFGYGYLPRYLSKYSSASSTDFICRPA